MRLPAQLLTVPLSTVPLLTVLLSTVLLTSCLDPTVPQFQTEDPFYLVEGRILAGEDGSEVRVRASAFTSSTIRFEAIEDAAVASVETGGATVAWEAVPGAPGRYQPPAGFRANPGETWSLTVVLPDGTTVESAPERVPAPVAVQSLAVVFEQNSVFDAGTNQFIPRFELFLTYDDPADEDNFYAFDFRYWEAVVTCFTCERGRYRNGECVEDFSVMPRFDYYCDTEECFRETAGNAVVYGTDELSNGNTVSGFPIGGIPFMAFGGLLVEGSVLSISPEAYAYGRVIQDLTTGNAGLNATVPAALAGNVRNLDPAGRTVLGFVSVATAGRTRTFIERTEDTGTPLRFDDRIYPEPIVGPFVPPLAPCEVDGRTATRPVGWQE